MIQRSTKYLYRNLKFFLKLILLKVLGCCTTCLYLNLYIVMIANKVQYFYCYEYCEKIKDTFLIRVIKSFVRLKWKGLMKLILLQMRLNNGSGLGGRGRAARPWPNLSPTRKMHRCLHCNYSTPWHSVFIRHCRRHSGEKPFSCSFCPFRSSRKSVVIRHCMSKHSWINVLWLMKKLHWFIMFITLAVSSMPNIVNPFSQFIRIWLIILFP